MFNSIAAHKTVWENNSRHGITVRLITQKYGNQEATLLTANADANYYMYLFEDNFSLL